MLIKSFKQIRQMENNFGAITNMVLVSASFLLSTVSSLTFLYGFLFYVQNMDNYLESNWPFVRASFLLSGVLTNILVGILVDRDIRKKKRFLIFSNVFSALAIAIFFFVFNAGYNSVLIICLYGTILSIAYSFFEISLDASMVNIAGEKYGERLVTTIWLLRAVSFILAIFFGKSIYSNLGLKYLFSLSAIGFIVAAIVQSFVQLRDSELDSTTEKVKTTFADIIEGFRESLRYVKSNSILRFLMILNVVVAMFYMPLFDAILPAMVKNLGLSDLQLANIEVATWVGCCLGALIVFRRGSNVYYLKRVFKYLKWEVLAIFGLIFPLIFTNLSNSQITGAIFMLVLIDGALNVFQVLGALAYYQLGLPDEVRGKMMGSIKTVMKISAPIGTVIYGIILNFVSWHYLIIISAVVIFIIASLADLNKPFKAFSEKL